MKDIEVKNIESHELEEAHYDLLLEADPSEKEIVKYIHRSQVFVLTYNNELVGLVVLVEEEGNLEIKNLSIYSAFQNRGFGSYLISYCIQYAKGLRYKELYIGTGSTSFQQLYLYQKHGFRMNEIITDFFKSYDPSIYENNLRLLDLIMLKKTL